MISLDLAAAAAFLGIHPDTLAERARAGMIPGAKIGREWRFLQGDIEHAVATFQTQKGLVYAIDEGLDDSPVKFGFSRHWTQANAAARIASLQCGNPRKLRMVCSFHGSRGLEFAIHRFLFSDLLQGEWFTRGELTRAVLACENAAALRELVGAPVDR